MQIVNSNPLAAQALWGALAALADRVVEDCACLLKGFSPYSVVYFKHAGKEHININVANAGFRVSRSPDACAVHEFRMQQRGYVRDVILATQKWDDGREFLEAVELFSGLITFVENYRSTKGDILRQNLAKAEVATILKNQARDAFYGQLMTPQREEINLRSFYKQDVETTDLFQLIDAGAHIAAIHPAGVYHYASIAGGGGVDTIVVISKTGHVAALNLGVNQKFLFVSTCEKATAMIAFMGGVGAKFISSLVDETSFVGGLLTATSVE